MIFCAKQLVEKAREHNTIVYMLFVDLRKACDSIACQALWLVLLEYGIILYTPVLSSSPYTRG